MSLLDRIRKFFPYEPTQGQEELLEGLAGLLMEREPHRVGLVKGYAGTGKTTIIGSLVKALQDEGREAILLAPTGRAAKVLVGYTGNQAFTIHKKIYAKRQDRDGRTTFQLAPNKNKNAVIIVDEASMISRSTGLAASAFQYRDLLVDLLEFVDRGESCQLLLIGDDAQLPPVKEDESPALLSEELEKEGKEVSMFELTEVLRQAASSGILRNATGLRNMIREDAPGFPKFDVHRFRDIHSVSGETLQDDLESAYGKYGTEGVIMICRSNKRANLFNQQIRARIQWREEDIEAGDLLMVVRNNYYWMKDSPSVGFIANGDIIEVLKIQRRIELYGARFAEVVARFIDLPDEPEIETILWLDTLEVDGPSMPREKMKELYYAVGEDHADITDPKKWSRKIMEDPFFNALQVKFSYAITCHKAQGGQWPAVFVDQGYLTEDMIDKEFKRWLYTAVTRATNELYLVNFHPDLFEAAPETNRDEGFPI